MQSREEFFKKITTDVMDTYHEKMHDYLANTADGNLTDADIIVMVMNITMSISTNIYFSLKQILPMTKLDFDYMKVTIINHLKDSFEEIKKFSPKEGVMPLTTDQIKEIQKNGFTIITMPDGQERKVSEKDLLIKKADADKIAESVKEQAGVQSTVPKIIKPSAKIIHKGN